MSHRMPDTMATFHDWHPYHGHIRNDAPTGAIGPLPADQAQSSTAQGASGPSTHQPKCNRYHCGGAYARGIGWCGATFCFPEPEAPDMPPITFEERRKQAEDMGHPAHLAHLVQYQYSLVLPDTQMYTADV